MRVVLRKWRKEQVSRSGEEEGGKMGSEGEGEAGQWNRCEWRERRRESIERGLEGHGRTADWNTE